MGAKWKGVPVCRTFSAATVAAHAEFLETDGTLILAVERNLFVLGGRQVENFEGQKFEGADEVRRRGLSSRVESGPEKSTKISGFSQSVGRGRVDY